VPFFQIAENRDVGVILVDAVLQLHLSPPQVIVAVDGRQVAVDRVDEVVIDGLRNLVGEERRVERALVSARLRVVDVALH